METVKNIFSPADILVPKENFEKWSVVACDQFTSQQDYWDKLEQFVGNDNSALNLILPEIYLENSDVKQRIDSIHKNMQDYLGGDVFKEYKNSLIYVRRTQSDGKMREGIVGKIDLEYYDYSKDSTSFVRATEATVQERIPPRIKVRNGAKLELPHIMILIDDDKKNIIEPLADYKNNLECVYDFDMNMGGGHISGYLLSQELQNQVLDKLLELQDKNNFVKKYGIENKGILTYAMGDGNHSLATAKAYYEQLKAENPDKDFSNHPARYALCEIVNLHSPALEFEAIFRLVYDVDKQDFINKMKEKLEFSETETNQSFTYVVDGKEVVFNVGKPTSKLAVGTVDGFVDAYLKQNGGKVDYIHGEQTVKELASQMDAVAIILPVMKKEELFPTVLADGALPRKTFSMGHAEDKRYYIEARKITE